MPFAPLDFNLRSAHRPNNSKLHLRVSPLPGLRSAAVGELESFSRDLVEGGAYPQCNQPLFDLQMSGKELPQFYEQTESSPPLKVGTSWN